MTKPCSPNSASGDAAAGFEVLEHFERFNPRNDIFNRSLWDARIRSRKSEIFYESYAKPLEHWRKVEGFGQKDYALRNAAWFVTDLVAGFNRVADRREGFLDEYSVHLEPAAERLPVESPAQMSAEIKRIARLFGADLVGITHMDERWLYTNKYSRLTQAEKPNELLDGLQSVIVLAQEMEAELIDTAPSALSGAATGLGYSKDTVVLLGVTQYIRNLGYRAVASLNDSALAIPLAIQAGLGEYGRHGLLITKEFGPRVRLGKIFTDLPLAHDQPIHFGVREFCNECRQCTQACPAKAISNFIPTAEIFNQSNLVGVRKWSVDAEKCFKFWVNQNSDCSICIRVCPYNRDFSKWSNRLWQRLAGTGLRKLMLKLHLWQGRGARLAPKRWWQRNIS